MAYPFCTLLAAGAAGPGTLSNYMAAGITFQTNQSIARRRFYFT